MKVTHLGHACLLVETDDARLLIDPGTMSEFATLTDLTAVLVSHQHADHLDAPTVADLLKKNPGARLVVDPDTVSAVASLGDRSTVSAARPGETLTFGRTTVGVHGGMHGVVYDDVPGCTNNAYLVDDGALFHPGDSFTVPPGPVDVLAVAIDAPWLKVAEAIDYVRAVKPRIAVPIHEAGANDPGKYIGMLAAFTPDGVVRQLRIDDAVEL